ncbi:MAG: DUF4358 domain-containing protein [bacterium]
MELIKKMGFLVFLFLMVGCSDMSRDSSNEQAIESTKILEAINNNNILFESGSIKNLKTQELANRYGIAVDDLKDGIIYFSTNENISDCIIIATAKDKDALEGIERALSSEIVSLSDSFKNNELESKKIENHIFKTKNLTVLLAISDETYTYLIEDIFDNLLEPQI